ncbi:MAG: GGDEF domain-containing protein [Clostridia bacterium]|nr:GGDEF domain-containing protein [Clostridia bacterium]
MKDEYIKNWKNLVIYSILSFLFIFIISSLVLFFIEKEVRTTRVEELKAREQRIVKLENDLIGRELSMLLSDLQYLHHAYQDNLFDTNDYSPVTSNWVEFSTQRLIYDQIRFLDANGDEKIRINIDSNGGYSVPEKDLQNKKDRYYFTETIKLNEDSVYFSPLDLNIEHNEIEIPYKPMIRISTPIYDDQGTLKGIIVLNYLADSMLANFRELASSSLGEVLLLNEAGYRLSSSDADNDWNFMFDEKKGDTFKKEYPTEWMAIINNELQKTTDKGLITAMPVVLSQKFNSGQSTSNGPKIVLGDGSWYVVSVFERNTENSEYFDDDLGSLLLFVLAKNGFYILIIGILSGLIGFLVYANRKTYSRVKFHSEFDSLTQTFNRRAGIVRLNNLFPADERRHFVVSLCFVDINCLKEINDALGHKIGDELIVSVAEVIKEKIRAQDFVIRLGGDEFLIVFNGINAEMAEIIWRRIVQSYEQINQDEDRPYIISASHGIVDFDIIHKTHVDDLINTADEKMYKEKQNIKAGLNVLRETIKTN